MSGIDRRIGVQWSEVRQDEAGSGIPVPDRITVQPAIPEWDDRAEDWIGLYDALTKRGFHVQIPEHKAIPSGADLPEFIPIAFVVYVGYKATDALIGALVDELTTRIINRVGSKFWKKGDKAKGIIYGPDGEVLKEIVYEPKHPGEDGR